ncbi:hypothetical protein BH23GEM3_BH23GEM3_02190 [soil metagenome]
MGITRAEQKLYLTTARRRRRGAEWLDAVPSSFIESVPGELLETRQTPRVQDRFSGSRPWRSAAISAQPRRRTRLGLEAAPPPVDPGYQVDYADSQDAPRLIKGARVRHPQFGVGTVAELSGAGVDVRATIEFDEVGLKKVVVRYANLQSEWE